MEGIWLELKIRLEIEDYEKFKSRAAHQDKEVGAFIYEILQRYLKENAV